VTAPDSVDKLLYTPRQAAEALGVSRSTLYVLMAAGDVPSVRIGACRRVPAEGLRRYVARLTTSSKVRDDHAHRQVGRPSQRRLWE
jgi:excisionase family DNA binding protein